jgi:hypothetical protein
MRITDDRRKKVSELLFGLLPKWLLLGMFLVWAMQAPTKAQAGTELDFWHSCAPPSGPTHFSFHVANYKRGLFFGSCGISTRSLQWEYDVTLTGNGPVYQQDQIAVMMSAGTGKWLPWEPLSCPGARIRPY